MRKRYSVSSTRGPERVVAEEARRADDLVGVVRLDAGVFEPAPQLLEPGVDAQEVGAARVRIAGTGLITLVSR